MKISTTALAFCTIASLAPGAIDAQRSAGARAPARVALSAVLSAFLADSGVQTRGLPWTTGSALPIAWTTPQAVRNSDPNAYASGLTLRREGTFKGTVGDSVPLDMSIVAIGSPIGLAQVAVMIPSMLVETGGGGGFFVTREMVEQALKNEGVALQPIKCSREKEGASYGNLVDAIKVPGKTASGLWWYWDSPQQAMVLSLTLLYRRADMAQVECQG